jgi:hypothetical protein
MSGSSGFSARLGYADPIDEPIKGVKDVCEYHTEYDCPPYDDNWKVWDYLPAEVKNNLIIGRYGVIRMNANVPPPLKQSLLIGWRFALGSAYLQTIPNIHSPSAPMWVEPGTYEGSNYDTQSVGPGSGEYTETGGYFRAIVTAPGCCEFRIDMEGDQYTAWYGEPASRSKSIKISTTVSVDAPEITWSAPPEWDPESSNDALSWESDTIEGTWMLEHHYGNVVAHVRANGITGLHQADSGSVLIDYAYYTTNTSVDFY